MHIVYTACGESAKADVLLSVKTLWLFASLSQTRGKLYYHIHVLTDGAMTPDDLSFLRPSSHYQASVHPLFHGSAYLFRPCSSERLYMHEHADFQHIDKVIPHGHAPLHHSCREFRTVKASSTAWPLPPVLSSQRRCLHDH